MTSVPPAAPETDVRLTEAERTILTAHFWGRRITANATHLADLIAPAVERIVAERVRVVEGERDAWKATASDTRKWALAEIDKADARAESAEAAHRALQAAVEALVAHGRGPDGEPLPEWVHVDELRALLAGGAR